MVQFTAPEGVGSIGGIGARGPLGALSPKEQGIGEPGELYSRGGKSEPQVVVLRPPLIAVAAQLLDIRPAVHHARVHERGFHEEVGGYIFMADEPVLPLLVPCHPEAYLLPRKMPERAGNEPCLGAGGEQRHLRCQSLRVRDIVAVHPGDKRSPALFQPQVQGGDQPLSAVKHPDARVACRRLGQDAGCPVGRTVVHSHQLPIVKGLRRE